MASPERQSHQPTRSPSPVAHLPVIGGGGGGANLQMHQRITIASMSSSIGNQNVSGVGAQSTCIIRTRVDLNDERHRPTVLQSSLSASSATVRTSHTTHNNDDDGGGEDILDQLRSMDDPVMSSRNFRFK